MPVTNALAGIAVRDLEKSVAWYERLLGQAPDVRPMPNLAEWRFPQGGWIQVFQDATRAGHSSVTLVEPALSERLADLKAKNIRIVSTDLSETVEIAIIADPDGNQIVFAHGKDDLHRSTG